MIEEINISQLGVIEQSTLPLAPGFTVVTGETGAGKTMVVTALGLLLGLRSDSAAVRHGQKSATVETRYILPKDAALLKQLSKDYDAVFEEFDGGAELIVSRTVYSNGRSRATLGGRQVPAGILQEVGTQLVAVHGQTDQLRLTGATAQRESLDQYAGEELLELLQQYQVVYQKWRNAETKLAEISGNVRQRHLEAESLRQALHDIDEVEPLEGEAEELKNTLRRLENLEGLRLAAYSAQAALSGGETADVETHSIAALIQRAQQETIHAAQEDEELAKLVARLDEISILASDLSNDFGAYLSNLDVEDLDSLGRIHERIAELNRITRKYGEHGASTLDDVLQWSHQARHRLIELDSADENIEVLEEQVRTLDVELNELTTKLSEIREGAAENLAAAVSAELSELSMPHAQLVVNVTAVDQRTSYGADEIEMLLQPHPGAAPRPLGKGASGGELSRVMLAIEVVLADKNPVSTMVFDEVDAGVGGAAAVEIGRRLAILAQHTQVIVVTHLPQVAAFADNHIRVLKETDENASVTSSDVAALDEEQRVLELARMLSGHQDSVSAQEHARELLKSSTVTA